MTFGVKKNSIMIRSRTYRICLVVSIILLVVASSFFAFELSLISRDMMHLLNFQPPLIVDSLVGDTNGITVQDVEGEDHRQRGQPIETSSVSIKNDVEDESANDSFSACILWMDDNHRLDEWLAYHYYLLKLRYVVLNVDHFSRTSPRAAIDRWNDRDNKYNLNMTIVVMTDIDYTEDFKEEMEKIEKASLSPLPDREYRYGKAKTDYHRRRQPRFYKACSKHLVLQNRSWTSFHDTDEFLTFDHEHKGKDITAISARKMKQPGYILHKLNSIKKKNPPDIDMEMKGLSCLVVNRRRHCAKALNPKETNDMFSPLSNSSSISSGVVPEGLMNSGSSGRTDEDREKLVQRFDTLRYKYLTKGGDGMPKSFVDLSQRHSRLYVQDQWAPTKSKKKKYAVHLSLTQICHEESKHRLSNIKSMIEKERFVVSHFLGSFEFYSFRDDARQGGLRNYEVWKKRANDTMGEYSHVMRPWLRGFVDLVGGPDIASYLLQDAGRFPDDYDVEARILDYRTKYDFDRGKKNSKIK